MASGLAFGLTSGAGVSSKMVKHFKRRELFCISHLIIGISLCCAGLCLKNENGLSTFFFIWCAQFWLQILTAPLFIYQTEVLENNALSMVTSWRSACFTLLKILVINIITSRNPFVNLRLYEVLYFFGLIQLLAVGIIWSLLSETANLSVKDKR
jgi:hypothetical protein